MERYRVIRRIGQGSHGVCSLVEDSASCRLLVLKQMNIDHLHEAMQARALNEAILLQRLDHSNIIKYYDSFSHEQSVSTARSRVTAAGKVAVDPGGGSTTVSWSERLVCIVMEFAERGDLAKDLAARRASGCCYLDEEEVMLIFVQLVLALKYLHHQKVLHRDLKTSNVFLGHGHVAKLGDFGIAKQMNEDTLACTLIGSPFYM